MKKQNKKEEQIQNRREFFKNAAKKALPIIAVAALSSMPLLSKASININKENPATCSDGSCYTTCTGCYSSCTGSCEYECKGYCKGYCTGSCEGSCGGCGGCSGCNTF
jgi:CXXX repeat radical SAM target protein